MKNEVTNEYFDLPSTYDGLFVPVEGKDNLQAQIAVSLPTNKLEFDKTQFYLQLYSATCVILTEYTRTSAMQ